MILIFQRANWDLCWMKERYYQKLTKKFKILLPTFTMKYLLRAVSIIVFSLSLSCFVLTIQPPTNDRWHRWVSQVHRLGSKQRRHPAPSRRCGWRCSWERPKRSWRWPSRILTHIQGLSNNSCNSTATTWFLQGSTISEGQQATCKHPNILTHNSTVPSKERTNAAAISEATWSKVW